MNCRGYCWSSMERLLCGDIVFLIYVFIGFFYFRIEVFRNFQCFVFVLVGQEMLVLFFFFIWINFRKYRFVILGEMIYFECGRIWVQGRRNRGRREVRSIQRRGFFREIVFIGFFMFVVGWFLYRLVVFVLGFLYRVFIFLEGEGFCF